MPDTDNDNIELAKSNFNYGEDYEYSFDKTDIDKNFYILFVLAKMGGIKNEGIQITTQEFAEKVGYSQQTISRRFKELRERKLLIRDIKGSKTYYKITSMGRELLRFIFHELKTIFNGFKETEFTGVVRTGMGEGAWYVSLSIYYKYFTDFLGSPPFAGTLNLELEENCINDYFFDLNLYKPKVIEPFTYDGRVFGRVNCYDIEIVWPRPKKTAEDKEDSKFKCLILDIRRTSHKKGTVEIVSNINLREKLNLIDGSKVIFKFLNKKVPR